MTVNREFISEGELVTFEGWMNYQAIDIEALEPAELESWRALFEQIRQDVADRPVVGVMELKPREGEYLYAVAVEDATELWLTLWIRRSRKGEFFVLQPRSDRKADHHTSYHLSGHLHTKSHGRKFSVVKRQPLTGEFHGIVGLGTYYGHGPKGVGAVCDPDAFSDVVRVPSGILGPAHGGVEIYLAEPDYEIPDPPWSNVVAREVFQDFMPHLVISVGCDHERA